MTLAIREATRIQIGKESTPGTTVAATRRLVGTGATLTREITMESFAAHNSGVLTRVARAPVVTRRGSALQYKGPLSYDEILMALLMGVKGGVAPVVASGESTWTFTPTVTAVPGQDSYTFEWVEDDLAGNADEVEAGFAFVESFEIAGGLDLVPTLTINFRFRTATRSTATGSIAVPIPVESPNLLWTHFIDATWAGLGVTAVLGQVEAFTYKFDTGLRPGYYQDGRTGLDFSIVQAGKRSADLMITAAINPAASGFVRSEEAFRDAGTLRFYRMQQLGPVITTNPYMIRIDGAYYHAPDSMTVRGNDTNGVMMTTVHLMSALDTVSSKDVSFVVVNALAAFPA